MSTTASGKPAASHGYSLARAQGKCAACARPIAPGEKLYAGLRETPALLERIDVCPQCWPNVDKSPLLGYWQTVMPQPAARKKLFVDDEVLCDLFQRLADAAEDAKVHFRFVLGLILMRKRRIVYESSRKENGLEIWSVRFRGSQDSLDLVDPRLTEQQIAQVSTQLGEILNEEL